MLQHQNPSNSIGRTVETRRRGADRGKAPEGRFPMQMRALATALMLAWFIAAAIDANAAPTRFTNAAGQQCVSDVTRADSAGTVTTEFCCESNEIMRADYSCIDSTMEQFFNDMWDYVTPGTGSNPGGGTGGDSGGIGLPSTPPERPTPQQCQAADDSCQAKSGETTERCEASKLKGDKSLVEKPLGQIPGTCYGNEADLREHYVSTVFGYYCSDYELKRDSWCRTSFKQVALYQCINGWRSTSIGSSETTTFSVNLGGYASLGMGQTTSVTITTPAGAGLRQHCAEQGRAHSNACVQKNRECLDRAAGTSPRRRAREQDVEALIARIDQTRLGLGSTAVGAPVRGSFRPLARDERWESNALYVLRLNWLANWSEFIKSNGVTRTQQGKAQIAFSNAQAAFKESESRLAALTAAYVFPHPGPNNDGERLAKLELLRYTKLGEYDRRITRASQRLRTELVNALGYRRANAFLELAWEGIYDFGFSEPMSAPQEMVQLRSARPPKAGGR